MKTDIQKLSSDQALEVQKKILVDLAELIVHWTSGATNREEKLGSLQEMFKTPEFERRVGIYIDTGRHIQDQIDFHQLCVDAHNKEFEEARQAYKDKGH